MSKYSSSSQPCGGFPVIKPPYVLDLIDGKTASIRFMSDLHIGAAAVDYDCLKNDIEQARLQQDRVLVGGDLLDLILTRDRKRFHLEALHPRLRDSSHLVNAAMDWAEELLAPIASQIDLIGPGNHETKFSQISDFDPLIELAKRLTARASKGHSVPYGGYAGLINYTLKTPCKKSTQQYKIVHWHGAGHGGSLSTALGEFSQKLGIIENADVLWFAHRHHRLACQVERVSLLSDQNCRNRRTSFEMRPLWLLRSGSYFQPYSHQGLDHVQKSGRHSSYAADSLLLPGGRGSVRLVLGYSDRCQTISSTVEMTGLTSSEM
jgi:hypothetical protein